MMQQFKSMNELVEYLGKLEGRVQSLEEENQRLRAAPIPASTNNVDERSIAKMVASFLPLTNIVHPNFWKRALAVWGHYFVIQFIISVVFLIFYFCLLSALFSRIPRTP